MRHLALRIRSVAEGDRGHRRHELLFVAEQQAVGSPLARASCTGGQGTSPNEQNTQQSPGFGFTRTPQLGHL
jgi:hypothetical protein